jgi:signal peptidase I
MIQNSEGTKSTSQRHRNILIILVSLTAIGLVALPLFCPLLFAVFVANLKPFRVVGNAMAPTIINGDCLLVSRGIGQIERGDIVIFSHFDQPTLDRLMRVIALPNDTIRIDGQGQLYLNGQLIEEPYISTRISQPDDLLSEKTLGLDEYWLLGDNRDNSNDSRVWGPLPADQIYGEVLWRYWPLNRIGAIE